MITNFPKAVVLAAAAILAGCGGAPSDDEFRSAMQAQISSVAGQPAGGALDAELAKTKLVGCAKAEPAGYKCDWTGPLGSGSGRFVKSDGGWKFVGP